MSNNYHQGIAKFKISTFLLKKIRQEMFNFFLKKFEISEDVKIADYGSSKQESEDSNFFIKQYPYKENITSLSIFDNRSLSKHFPNIVIKIIKKDEKLQFEDNYFDILVCNAVLEHFSSKEILLKNIKEMSRVSKNLFITLPNYLFPIEHHTCIPLLHYLPKKIFRLFIKKIGFDFYSKKENLNFYSKKSIKKLLNKGTNENFKFYHTGLKLGLFSSNIAIIKKLD